MRQNALTFRKSALIVLALFLILSPFSSRAGAHTYAEAFLMLAGGLLFLLFVFLPERAFFQKFLPRGLDATFWWPIFLISLAVSLWFSVDRLATLEVVALYLVYAGLFFTARKINITSSELEAVTKSLLAVALVLSFIGISQYLTADITRVGSLFHWANAYAGWLLFSLPLCFFFLSTARRQGPILIFGIIASILGAALILTESRAAYVSLLLALPVTFFAMRGIAWRQTLARTIAVCIGIILVASWLFSVKVGYMSLPFLTKYSVGESATDLGIAGRAAYWQGAWDMFRARPLFGWGAGTYGVVYPQFQKGVLLYAKYPHNAYLEMLAETGIIGAIPFFLLFGSIVGAGMSALRNFMVSQKREQGLHLAVFSGILASLIHNGFDIDWHFWSIAVIFWIFSGFLFSRVSMSQGSRA